MEIKARKVADYVEVSIKEGSTTIDLGLLDKVNGHKLALELRDAVYDLNDKLNLGLTLWG